MSKPATTTDAQLTWTNETVAAGPGTRYDIASDLISVLWRVRSANAACSQTGVAGTTFTDARPVAADGWYYLVRAVNSCGPPRGQGWGSDSLGTPRPACP